MSDKGDDGIVFPMIVFMLAMIVFMPLMSVLFLVIIARWVLVIALVSVMFPDATRE